MQGQEQVLQDGTEVFFILRNQQVMPAQKLTPDSFYVKGIIENGDFVPKSTVLGTGELATTGRYGWLEFTTGEFVPMESGKKAITPFTKGYMTDLGFIPSVREVFTEPR